MPPPKVDKKARKEKFIKRIYELLSKHKQILFVTLENVGSNQVQQIRRTVSAGGGLLVIGKNTVIRKAIQLRSRALPDGEEYDYYRQFGDPLPELDALLPKLHSKIGFIFTDEPIFELKPKVEAHTVAAPARVGIFAPRDVEIPPGPTGMDPSQISFFHALSISTKIQKGQIEITKAYQVCVEGKKIGSSEVALLEKMNLKPFTYGMKVVGCYDDGSILDEDVLSLSPASIIEKFQQGIKNIAALSLQTGIPTEASVPHMVMNSFKNLAALGLGIDYKFKQLANASSGPAPAQGGAKQDAPKAEEKKPEPEEEEEEDMDMGGMFD